MADIFERAWGNYTAFLEYLINGQSNDEGDWFNESKGLVQLYSFASLLPYTLTADNYDNFLLLNAINYATSAKPSHNNTDHVDDNSQLEHRVLMDETYGSFLARLDDLIADSVDPSDEPKYIQLQEKISSSQTDLRNYQRWVDGLWSDYLANNPNIPVEELRARRIIWERENGHSMQLERLRGLLRQNNARLNAWLRSRIPSDLHVLLRAREFFDDPGYYIELPIAADHDDPAKLHYWRKFRMQLPLMNLDEFLKNDASVSHNFSSIEEHYKRVETKWKVKVKGRWGIFSGGGSAEKRKLEELSEKEEFGCEIGFKRFEEVGVFRDRWFQPKLFTSIGKDFSEFWGPNGLLGAIPVSLIVCRGMTVKVSISDEYRRTLEKYFRSGGSVRFGPFFSGGGSYSKNEKYMDYRFVDEQIELLDGDQTIRLLGARVARPNWNEDDADEYLREISDDELDLALSIIGGQDSPR